MLANPNDGVGGDGFSLDFSHDVLKDPRGEAPNVDIHVVDCLPDADHYDADVHLADRVRLLAPDGDDLESMLSFLEIMMLIL